MSTSASRRFRETRNALAEALGLGEAYPLRDLPVTADPPVVPFGGIASIAIDDSERAVTYRLLDQAGQPLPGNGGPQATGTGALLAIASPEVDVDVTYVIGAAKPNGRTATLFEVASLKVGLDASLPARITSVAGVPTVIDRGAGVIVAVDHSQEGVTYTLVVRPVPDPAKPDDIAAMATDITLSAAATGGTGDTITLASIALADDVVVRVRAVKTFTGPTPRPPQTVLLKVPLPVFVRPDAGLAVTAQPAIVDHAGTAGITIANAAPGVRYRLHARPVPDVDFSRVVPPDPATLAVPTPGGDVRIVVPPQTQAWAEPAGFAPLGDAVAGAGADLTLSTGALIRDALLIVEARKTHASGADAFTSAERLTAIAAVLVRPDPAPRLTLEAVLADGKLGEIDGLLGEPGVFYAIAAPTALGELYFHQPDPGNATRNKGIGALAIEVDLVPGAGAPDIDSRQAPPPLPRLPTDGVALPATLKIGARRAMTGLTADVGTVVVAPLPAADAPANVAAGSAANVIITAPVIGERYRLLVDGKPVADAVVGGAAALTLATSALAAGATVELWAAAGDAGAAITVARRAALPIKVG